MPKKKRDFNIDHYLEELLDDSITNEYQSAKNKKSKNKNFSKPKNQTYKKSKVEKSKEQLVKTKSSKNHGSNIPEHYLKSSKKIHIDGKITCQMLSSLIKQHYNFVTYKHKVYVMDKKTFQYKVQKHDDLPGLIGEIVTEDTYDRIDTEVMTKKLNERLWIDQSKRIEEIPRYRDFMLANNGVVSIRDKKIVPRDYNKVFIWRLNFNYIDNPKKSKMPYWIKFMETLTNGDKELQELIECIVANLLTGKNFDESLITCGYAAASGKTSFLNFCEKVAGAENVSAIPLAMFGGRFSLADAGTALYNVDADAESNINRSGGANLKKAIGDDRLVIESKGKDIYTARINFPIISATNKPLNFKDLDDGIIRRLLAVPCEHTVAKEDRNPDLVNCLYKERDYIISRCINKFSKALEVGHFPKCKRSEEVKREWIDASRQSGIPSSIREFVEEELEFTDESEAISSSDIYSAYIKYCGEECLAITYEVFSRYLKSNYPVVDKKRKCKKTGKKIHFAVGVAFKNSEKT